MFESVAPLGLKPSDITSVVSGPHKGKAHPEGRAIDVGAISGQVVGMNEWTWQFIARTIAQGGVQAIGTIAPIVNNPQMQEYARAHGVNLFLDDKSTGATGDHIHLQVP